MRLPNSEHESHAWRIHEVAPDFRLEDVWALPVYGGAEDFPVLLRMVGSGAPSGAGSLPARALWLVRGHLGRLLGWDEAAGELPIPGTGEASLADRLPADLRNSTTQSDFGSSLFAPVYRTDDEFAAELSNRTVHGVLHLAWVDRGGGRDQGQMAVYVKPRGRLGRAYMALIKPFRHRIVYPAIIRQLERAWNARAPQDRRSQTAGRRACA
jgi:hypothetical protein